MPQGSILGPLLFLMLMIFTVLLFTLSFILFSDDTTFLSSHSDFDSLVSNLNTELTKVSSWFQANTLSLNSSITKNMVFSRSQDFCGSGTVKINDTAISKVHCTNFPGPTTLLPFPKSSAETLVYFLISSAPFSHLPLYFLFTILSFSPIWTIATLSGHAQALTNLNLLLPYRKGLFAFAHFPFIVITQQPCLPGYTH